MADRNVRPGGSPASRHAAVSAVTPASIARAQSPTPGVTVPACAAR